MKITLGCSATRTACWRSRGAATWSACALCDTLTATSLCAFGPGVAQAARSIMRVYADEFDREGQADDDA